ncbi:hypothetical protein LTR37_015018 [Vermiconidia calcicola]|uniref:Uncharacterized protein n=1 Tax=Vermiconidia calcicola TaxID=1690605 RepID=A0ACC3MRR0_9PEZI|nr:hypothetical protein LTR37_015018 [Vermiconidia calcicola]
MAESTTASPRGEQCQFFSLPRELRDEIYDYAYTPHKNTEYWYRITAHDINATTEDFMAVGHDGWSMAPTLCQAVAVNRQYLSEALPYWIQRTNFHFSSPRDFDYLTHRYPLIEENLTSVFVKYDSLAARHELDVPIGEIVNLCPRLTRFEACLHGREWCGGDEGFSNWEFSIRFEVVVLLLKEMRDLRSFRLSSSDFCVSEYFDFAKDLKAVEEDIRECVSENNHENE